MDSAFINIARGNRITSYLGLEMTAGKAFRYCQNVSAPYTYIEIPLEGLINADGEQVEKALQNQKLLVKPACRLDLKGPYRVMVKTNPRLSEFADCPSVLLLDPGEKEQPYFYASFRKGMAAIELDWAVRLYMMS